MTLLRKRTSVILLSETKLIALKGNVLMSATYILSKFEVRKGTKAFP